MGISQSKHEWSNQSLLETFAREFEFEGKVQHFVLGKCDIYKSLFNPDLFILKHSRLFFDDNFNDFRMVNRNFEKNIHPQIIACYGSLKETSNGCYSSANRTTYFFEFFKENLLDLFNKHQNRQEPIEEKSLIKFYEDFQSVTSFLKENYNGVSASLFELENIFITNEGRLKFFPKEIFFRNSGEKVLYPEKKIKDLFLNLACLGKNQNSLNERVLILQKNYSLDFIANLLGFGENKPFFKKQERNETPKKRILKSLVSFSDETFFMSPIKNEANINLPQK